MFHSETMNHNGNGNGNGQVAEASADLLQIKRELHQQVIGALDLSTVGSMPEDELRLEVRRLAEQLSRRRKDLLSHYERETLVNEVLDEVFGLGPLEPLFQDDEISDILVNGPDTVYVERHGRLELTDVKFVDAAHVLAIIHRVAGRVGRRIDETTPMVDARLADGIRQYGNEVGKDLHELWRRLVFSLLVCNYDDHLRNHGFLMLEPGRWSLSPAYDINPVPEMDRVHMAKTAITEEAGEPTIDLTLAMAGRFGLKPTEAKASLREIYTAVSGWRKTGRQLRLKASTLEAYASAFEHPLQEEARRLVA